MGCKIFSVKTEKVPGKFKHVDRSKIHIKKNCVYIFDMCGSRAQGSLLPMSKSGTVYATPLFKLLYLLSLIS